MDYRLCTQQIDLTYSPEASALTVLVAGSDVTWSWTGDPFLVLAGGKTLTFSSAACESLTYNTGVSQGVRAVYSAFTDGEGNSYPYIVETCVSVDPDTGFLKAEARVDGDAPGEIAALAYPPRMKFDAPKGHGYTVLPRPVTLTNFMTA